MRALERKAQQCAGRTGSRSARQLSSQFNPLQRKSGADPGRIQGRFGVDRGVDRGIERRRGQGRGRGEGGGDYEEDVPGKREGIGRKGPP